jgi:hypothetical protein
MEGGDLLGAYERACELAEMNARLAGIENPISAMHLQNGIEGPAHQVVPRRDLIQVSL